MNYAFLQTQLKNLKETPLILSLDYESKSSNKSTKFFVEIRDSEDQNKSYFMRNISDTSDKIRNKLLILPRDLGERPIKFRFGIVTSSTGE